ncbi:MAG: prephenate dehydratase [Christensenellales bacterium]|jgi:chorismate mutase/prephenate dehydratase
MGYDEEINALREKINQIDAKLVPLFADRMELAVEVAKVKQKYGRNVFDAKREKAVIDHTISLLKKQDYREETKSFFRAVMELSKKSQQRVMLPNKTNALKTEIFTDIRVGYLGIRGSFSHIAAEETFGQQSVQKNYDTFEAIFEGIKNGEIGNAIVPAENTETGSITAVIDLLAKYGYYIVAEKLLKVSHSLLGVRGANISGIKKIYSHPEPLAQCRTFLNTHPEFEAHPSLSTAQAAITVAEQGDPSVGCIASVLAAKIYGLDVLQEDIQNNNNNYTRFVVISKQPYRGEECSKASIVFMVEHRPGSLCEILNIFSNGKINILKLESRPLKERPFEYMFHLDFEGSMYDPNISRTIESVKNASADFIYLGCYKREHLNV